MLKPRKRLPKDERRAQLLRTAMAILRKEGAEALTLGHVAERAGVTKPIAYEHFGTRGGLLTALFHEMDDPTTEALREALASGGRSLEDVTAILSHTYIIACQAGGPEFRALLDALEASDETAGFLREWRAFLVEEFRKGLTPFVRLPRRQLEAVLLGLLGAAEALSEAATGKRLSHAAAEATLQRIMLGALKG
jgi:AcrR family transcriptional regulator